MKNVDLTEEVGDYYLNDKINLMNSKFFTWSWTDLKSGLVSGIIVALIAMGDTVIEAKSLFAVHYADVLNAGAFALIVFCTSMLKSLFTNSEGKFAGAIKVK